MKMRIKKLALFIIIDIVAVALVGISSIIMRHFCTPYKRGFFQDDESLMHPFHSSTITSTTLYTVGFIIPFFLIIVTEVVLRNFSTRRSPIMEGSDRNTWLLSVVHIIAIFFFGSAATHFLTNVPKYSIGRLRPHFFDVCKPDFSLLNNTQGYIVADICTGRDRALINEARLSFPSGHSSIAMYIAFFVMLYLQNRIVWRSVPLLRPLLQIIVFSMAFFTCLSRISDYKHHWSDVLAGGVLGAVLGVLAFKLIKTDVKEKQPKVDGNIPL